MKSKKINKNKKMLVLWISLALLLAIFLIFASIKYSPIKKAQNVIIAGMFEVTDYFDEYKNNRGEMVRQLENYFDVGYATDPNRGYDIVYWNALVDVRKAEEGLMAELLKISGYGSSHSVRHWLRYGGFGQYCISYFMGPVVIITAITIALIIASILYIKDKKTELTIQDNSVIGKKSNGKTIQFLLKDIKSVEITKTHGLKITGTGIKYSIHSIANNEEMKSAIMNMLTHLPIEQPTMTALTSTAGTIKEYKDLLDAGIITQEEFDAKKKQLLGL